MNKLNKIILVLFSVIILLLGVTIFLLAAGFLEFNTAFALIRKSLIESPSNQVILIVTLICMFLALIAIFSDTSDKKEPKNGRDVLMQNDNGKLMISRDTLENIVNGVVKRFEGARESNTRIQLDSENNVSVMVDLTVTKEVVIKELTLNMQNKIKEAIKKTSDLDVKEVNVRIKNIEVPVDENKAQ